MHVNLSTIQPITTSKSFGLHNETPPIIYAQIASGYSSYETGLMYGLVLHALRMKRFLRSREPSNRISSLPFILNFKTICRLCEKTTLKSEDLKSHNAGYHG